MRDLGVPRPIVSLSEAQAFVRVETGEEEALLAGLIRSASALCEAFLDQAVIARPFSDELPGAAAWQRLSVSPVRSIDTVETIAEGGAATPVPLGGYAADIDASGDGWVRVDAVTGWRIRVGGSAGLAADENDVPEPIRHGVLRLVAHLYSTRDGAGGEPPAAVTALWRPYRRMRLA